MHGYYLHYHDINDGARKQTGIDRKVKGQIGALNKAGCECEFVFCKQPETVPKMIASCLPIFSDGITWPSLEVIGNADYLYIRRSRFASKEFISFLQAFRKINGDAKVLYEVPTYPYDGEMRGPKMFMALRKDLKYRVKLKDYVDYIVDLSGHDEIFGIPTVQIINGIDLDSVDKRKPSITEDKAIHVMCAAFFTKSHAIERFVEGLANYYNNSGKREIILHLAGEGTELNKTRKIVKKNSLESNVVFEGVLDRVGLDVLYDSCTFAVEALGLHRVGIDTISTIKSREYLAKGIPFIHSAQIDVFEDNPNEFCYQVPADESPIDIDAFLEFYDNLYAENTEQEIINSLRAYAEAYVGMDKAMSGVIELIKQHCG